VYITQFSRAVFVAVMIINALVWYTCDVFCLQNKSAGLYCIVFAILAASNSSLYRSLDFTEAFSSSAAASLTRFVALIFFLKFFLNRLLESVKLIC
jgi:uncharacterized SAM-binding protein YcdF (DUF218 family)